jgi:transcriptional regulator with XRE-family HTH domain
MITPDQCRAARALIGWNQHQLARAANISRETVADFETGKRTPIPNNLKAIEFAFSAADIALLDETANAGRGVRHAQPGGRDYDLEERERLVGALNRSMPDGGRP